MIKIEHHFLTTAHNLTEIFDKTNKISTFCRKLEKQAIMDEIRYPYNKYVGDGFEFLVELLIKLSPVDNRIGIVNYHPIKSNGDNGVDGYGVNLLNKKCAIQVKYRSNNTEVLTAGKDGLDSFYTEAMFEGVVAEKDEKCKGHYLFTTAEGLHHYTRDEKYRKTMKCIGYNELRELLDNNVHFWNAARETIQKNLIKK